MNELDRLYLEIDELMRDKRLTELEKLLSAVQISTTSTDLLLGYLTATLPVRKKLSCRKRFCEDVKHEIMKRNEYQPGLLNGLE